MIALNHLDVSRHSPSNSSRSYGAYSELTKKKNKRKKKKRILIEKEVNKV